MNTNNVYNKIAKNINIILNKYDLFEYKRIYTNIPKQKNPYPANKTNKL